MAYRHSAVKKNSLGHPREWHSFMLTLDYSAFLFYTKRMAVGFFHRDDLELTAR